MTSRAVRILGLALLLLCVAPTVAAADAEKVVREFLKAVKAGDLDHAKRLWDARYRSLPAEGVDAIFHYESAYQPNLAFLVGQPFDVARVDLTIPIRSEWYVLDGTRGHQVTARLRFEGERGPFFLPSPIAFGRSMEFVDFMNFVKHPERERYADLTLRLRPRLALGLIPTPRGPMVKVPPPPVPGGSSAQSAVIMPAPAFQGGLFGARPRDPGRVVLPSGEALTEDQIAALLPRLRACDVLLTAMQRGRFASWRVEDAVITNVTLVFDGAELPLR